MYIYCSSSKEKYFVRFGKKFKHGKSINYLAMTDRVKDIYSRKLAELQYGYITEEEFNAWCEDALDSFVWEPHVSCFDSLDFGDGLYLPSIDNVSQAKTLIGFIKRMENDLPCQAYLVKGFQNGTGTDKEPLVDITYEEPVNYTTDELIDVVLDAFENGFEYTKKVNTSTDDFVYISGYTFQYKNKQFTNPYSWFIKDYQYKGQVMEKFKYEDIVPVNYDDMQCIFICAEDNGGVEEISDCIWAWGESIYERPTYFENRHHVAIDITSDGDIYVCGDSDGIFDFTNEYCVDYEEVDAPHKLEQKFKSMKFYE